MTQTNKETDDVENNNSENVELKEDKKVKEEETTNELKFPKVTRKSLTEFRQWMTEVRLFAKALGLGTKRKKV